MSVLEVSLSFHVSYTGVVPEINQGHFHLYCFHDSLLYQLDAQILYFNTFITLLYMFRTLLCSSSGLQIASV